MARLSLGQALRSLTGVVAAACLARIAMPVVAGEAPVDPDCDGARGRAVFAKCAICHTNDAGGRHSVGPNLYRVVGRRIAAADGFAYSDELKRYGEEWSPELLDRFIADPLGQVPGTTMAFGGLSRAQDRLELLCYLKSAANE
jgi:cytochrome c